VAHANRLAALAAALSEAVSPADVAAVVVDHAIDALGAGAAALSLFTHDGPQLELIHAKGYPVEIAQRWRRFEPSQFSAIEECLRTGKLVWLEAEPDRARLDPEREEPAAGSRNGARAALPLITHGAASGVLYINFGASRPLEPDEITFLTTLGHQCAQAVERARLYEREHHAAETFQRALLPVAIPAVPGIAIHTVYQPGAHEANVGGDWYDVFRLPSGKVVVSVGDVAGRGLAAAVVMGELRQTIRTAALEHHEPAAVLRQTSEALVLAHGREAMATAIVAVLDPLSSVLTYATAGHPAPVLAVPGSEPVVLPTAGVPLGYLSTTPAPSWTVTLPAGALLVLYTDGLIEHQRDIEAGQEALTEAAQREMETPGGDPARGILRRVLGSGHSSDDVAVIALALDRVPLDRFDLTLPAEPESAAVIRQTVRRLARIAGMDGARTAALTVAVGEAVNNAIEHAYRVAGGAVHVQGACDAGAVNITIRDTGTWRPAHADDGGGHGLRLIEQLADSLHVRQTPSGTTVVIVMRLSQPPAALRPPTATAPVTAPELEGAGIVASQAEEPRPSGPAGARVDRQHGVVIVELYGDLDATTADVVRAALAQAARDETPTVLVSLERAGYIDSLTIRELFAFGRDLTTRRRSLALIVPPGAPLERILVIAGLTRTYRVFESATDARKSMKEVPSGG
ncbi:MAG TPA: SpoIIE family protein phosphatase, partial [bacterium]|nr:SpoIIE family protein phosphatase [bacterium]